MVNVVIFIEMFEVKMKKLKSMTTDKNIDKNWKKYFTLNIFPVGIK